MVFDYRKLRTRIFERFGSFAAFAQAVKQSPVTIANKINGKKAMRRDDIISWSDALEIEPADISEYFYKEAHG